MTVMSFTQGTKYLIKYKASNTKAEVKRHTFRDRRNIDIWKTKFIITSFEIGLYYTRECYDNKESTPDEGMQCNRRIVENIRKNKPTKYVIYPT